MFTIKTTGYAPEGQKSLVNMQIYQADEVHERHNDGVFVGLTLFTAAQNTLSGVCFETRIIMDASRIKGPDTVFVENEQGRTVQRFSIEP